MADEQLNTPSAEPQPVDAPASEPTSDRSEDKPSETPSWWRRMFGRRGDVEEAEPSDTESGKADSTSQALTLTQEELDRRVQAETDRREAKRAAEARARQRKELRDSDPWQYAEEERKAEQVATTQGQWTEFFGSVGTEHDKVAIDPVVERLPKEELERIMKLDGAGTGLAGRKLIVQESLKALEKHWKTEGAKEAETKLRRNAAFRKQVLAEIRGQTAEPDLLPAYSASEADKTVSERLRSFYNLGSHNEINGH